MSAYRRFAAWYDQLLAPVDYPARAAYLLALFARHAGRRPASLLDLACGTGTLTRLLANEGVDMVGVDASPDMLAVARAAEPAKTDVLWVCQDLRELDLYGTAQGAVCTLDGINHLTPAGLAALFDRLQYFLDPGGLFIFDCNTPYKHQTVLANNTFVYQLPDVYCVWQNRTEGVRTAMTLDFFESAPDGRYARYTEHVTEQAYTAPELAAAAPRFTLIAAYHDGTLEPPAPETQRVVYVMQKQ